MDLYIVLIKSFSPYSYQRCDIETMQRYISSVRTGDVKACQVCEAKNCQQNTKIQMRIGLIM